VTVHSKCINCGKQRSCIKIEARMPLAHGPVLVWNSVALVHEQVDYETHGPMIEICRKCLSEDHGCLAKFLLEGLQ
jgi:hypothetical protein